MTRLLVTLAAAASLFLGARATTAERPLGAEGEVNFSARMQAQAEAFRQEMERLMLSQRAEVRAAVEGHRQAVLQVAREEAGQRHEAQRQERISTAEQACQQAAGQRAAGRAQARLALQARQEATARGQGDLPAEARGGLSLAPQADLQADSFQAGGEPCEGIVGEDLVPPLQVGLGAEGSSQTSGTTTIRLP